MKNSASSISLELLFVIEGLTFCLGIFEEVSKFLLSSSPKKSQPPKYLSEENKFLTLTHEKTCRLRFPTPEQSVQSTGLVDWNLSRTGLGDLPVHKTNSGNENIQPEDFFVVDWTVLVD